MTGPTPATATVEDFNDGVVSFHYQLASGVHRIEGTLCYPTEDGMGNCQPVSVPGPNEWNNWPAFAADMTHPTENGSGDGDVMAFVSGGDLYTGRLAGLLAPTARRVTFNHKNDAPAYAGFGTGHDRLIWASNRSGNWEIWSAPLTWPGVGYEGGVAPAIGTATNLTKSAKADRNPDWRPIGGGIAFDSARTGNRDIYVMRPDGSGLRRVTTSSAVEVDPSWWTSTATPWFTGTVAYQSNKAGNQDVWVKDLATGVEKNLTKSNKGYDGQPALSPSGRWVAFVSDRSGRLSIWIVSVDGSTLWQLTTSFAPDVVGVGAPFWGTQG